jgi:hypothetical protein
VNPLFGVRLIAFGRWADIIRGELSLPFGSAHAQCRCAICTRLPQVSSKTAVVTGPIATGG